MMSNTEGGQQQAKQQGQREAGKNRRASGKEQAEGEQARVARGQERAEDEQSRQMLGRWRKGSRTAPSQPTQPHCQTTAPPQVQGRPA